MAGIERQEPSTVSAPIGEPVLNSTVRVGGDPTDWGPPLFRVQLSGADRRAGAYVAGRRTRLLGAVFAAVLMVGLGVVVAAIGSGDAPIAVGVLVFVCGLFLVRWLEWRPLRRGPSTPFDLWWDDDGFVMATKDAWGRTRWTAIDEVDRYGGRTFLLQRKGRIAIVIPDRGFVDEEARDRFVEAAETEPADHTRPVPSAG
jgi:hypothetical protein